MASKIMQKDFQLMLNLLPGLFLCSRLVSLMSASSTDTKTRMQRKIEEVVTKEIAPTYLAVYDDLVPIDGEKPSDPKRLISFIRLIVVTPKFENKTKQESLKIVEDALMKENIFDLVHSLVIMTKTPDEWKKMENRELKNEDFMWTSKES